MSNGSIIGMTNPSLVKFKANGVWTLTEQFNLFKSGGWPGAALYSFTSVLFNAGIDASRDPPTKQNIIDNITSTSLSSFQNNTDFFDVASGIITWKVPESGTYRIIAKGAAGGQSTNWGPQGGFGAIITGDFSLSSGTVLKMIVGQRGIPNTYEGGGGGGTFVTLIDNTPLIVAGGGGAGSASGFSGSGSKNANLTGNGYSTSWATGGTNGNGGGGYGNAGGGGGLTGNGTGAWYGRSFTNGGLGGEGSGGAAGGFGGGGGGGGTNGAPGGGGYSGGAAAPWSYEGAGGGSFNSGSNPAAVLNTVYERGSVTITKL